MSTIFVIDYPLPRNRSDFLKFTVPNNNFIKNFETSTSVFVVFEKVGEAWRRVNVLYGTSGLVCAFLMCWKEIFANEFAKGLGRSVKGGYVSWSPLTGVEIMVVTVFGGKKITEKIVMCGADKKKSLSGKIFSLSAPARERIFLLVLLQRVVWFLNMSLTF